MADLNRGVPEKPLMKIHQKKRLTRAGNGRIEPAQIVMVKPLFAQVALIHKYRLPLPSLRLLTRKRVSKFNL